MKILPFEALATVGLALQQAQVGLSCASSSPSSSNPVMPRPPAAPRRPVPAALSCVEPVANAGATAGQAAIGASPESRRAGICVGDMWVDAVVGTPKRAADTYGSVAIVTTAALPWLTGTAVNPLLRAAYLSKTGKRVTLVVPFLSLDDQSRVFPRGVRFATPEEQREYILTDLDQRVDFPTQRVDIKFYRGRYASRLGSIIPTEDITEFLEPETTGLVLLEEPEHLTWNHTGKPWKQQFSQVVGIAHTNYLDYARGAVDSIIAPAILAAINAAVCRRNCHRIIKLSDAVQRLPNQSTCNVNGVSSAFLAATGPGKPPVHFDKDIYFIGKAVWAKGFATMFDLANEHRAKLGADSLGRHPIDIYGDGPDRKDIERRARRGGVDVAFHGRKDHLSPELARYKIFWNPSTSEVLTTTTAEALAQGKFVLLPKHRCNAFFESFPNCLTYSSREEFHERLSHALSNEPQGLSIEQWRRLSWEGATKRLVDDIEAHPNDARAAVEPFASITHRTHHALLAVVRSLGLFR